MECNVTDRGVRRARRESNLLTGMDMDSSVWGPLPRELLELLFSYLPVQDICKLRVLSKRWKQNIDSVDSEFSHLLEETTYPRMFGVISLKSEGQFCGMVVDVKAKQRRSHRYPADAFALAIDPSDNYVTTMGASDGGLVCFLSRGTMRPKFIVVMNPLTGKKIELPGLRSMDGRGHVSSKVMPLMVQLIMDRQTWQYKVIIVANMDGATGKHFFAQIYDSVSKGWTVVGSEMRNWDRIFGYAYRSSINRERRLNCLALTGACAYDFASGLHYFRKYSATRLDGPLEPYPAPQGVRLVLPEDSIVHAVLKNRLFVLRSSTELSSSNMPISDYFISEYVLEKDTTAWVEVGTIRDLPLHKISTSYYSFFLEACKGFLLLFSNHNYGYVYDFSGRCWFDLPAMRPRPWFYSRNWGPVDLLCELRWNATP